MDCILQPTVQLPAEDRRQHPPKQPYYNQRACRPAGTTGSDGENSEWREVTAGWRRNYKSPDSSVPKNLVMQRMTQILI